MARLLAARVSQEDAAAVVDRWMRALKAGDKDALWLVPYLFGQPPKPAGEVTPTQPPVVVEIRRFDKEDAG
jgi:hypothetical protein